MVDVPKELEGEAVKDAGKFLHSEQAAVVNRLVQDNAYIILRGNSGKEVTIQYDLSTKKMLWHS